MQWLSRREEMQAADRWTIEQGIPGVQLMERAAAAVALRLAARSQPEERIVFLCGTGNNGGDGFAAAGILATKGWSQLELYLVGDPAKVRGDAAINLERLVEVGLVIQPIENWQAGGEVWIVDGLFGTGLNRPLAEDMVALIQKMNEQPAHKLAIDIPSGLDANTGQSWGAIVECVETVTFARSKVGMVLDPGRSYAGTVYVADIGIVPETPSLQETRTFYMEKKDIAEALPTRQANSHKGTYGRLLVVAGSETMTGAAILSCRAAYKAGAGLVEAAIVREGMLPLQCSLPEVILTPYRKSGVRAAAVNLKSASAVLMGPGLGQEEYVPGLLLGMLEKIPLTTPLVLDADALNWAAIEPEIKAYIQHRDGNTILTPHIKEASRLLGWPVTKILQDTVEAAKELAAEYKSCVILKNAVTVIASPEGEVCLNRTGNHGMATAGSGDVLAGLTGGLLAQGVPAYRAACVSPWLHGDAGDSAAAAVGQYGLMASDICGAIHLEQSVL